MKQHIAVYQLKELNEIQTNKIKLIMNWKHFSDFSFLITIGKMIEILNNEDSFFVSIRPSSLLCKESYVEISVKDKIETSPITWSLKGFHSKELVDTLWEAIKYTLGSE